MKYYEEGYHTGETFLLLTAEECAEYAKAPALKQGEKVYEDDTTYAFKDINPCAPVHIIVVPKVCGNLTQLRYVDLCWES